MIKKNYTEIEENGGKQIFEIEDKFQNKSVSLDNLLSQLKNIYLHIPENYLNSFEEDGKVYFKFWNKDEFTKYVEIFKPQNDFFWISNTYPKCCYLIAMILVEKNQYNDAISYLEDGLILEPDNPIILNEMGFTYNVIATTTKNNIYNSKAIESYKKAFDSRIYNSNKQKARSLRGLGYVYFDMRNFDESEKMYSESLKYEEHPIAKKEIEGIKMMKNVRNKFL